MALRGILLDIEGTILPKAYVTEVLFPYAQKHLATYLHAHREDHTVRRWAALCQETIAKESGTQLAYEDVAGTLTQWILSDRKHQGLKALQGMIWEEGYRRGVFAPRLYDDVVPALRRWRQGHLHLAIYSSGSEQAQRLLFEHTTDGDLTSLFSYFFDTGMGSKLEPASYRHIADRLGFTPAEVLFLSDVESELEAAATAGFLTTQVVRPGTEPTTRHSTVSTLNDLLDLHSLFTGSAHPLASPIESRDVS
ncbi:MAG: acireductone synthase [Nitrospira sp.]|nr:acireductone synthase [Nitrospira sp.]